MNFGAIKFEEHASVWDIKRRIFGCNGNNRIPFIKGDFFPQTRISEIINKKRQITADTAIRLSKFFGTSAKFSLDLQDDLDLEEEKSL